MDFRSLNIHFFDGIVKKKNCLAFFECNKSLKSSYFQIKQKFNHIES